MSIRIWISFSLLFMTGFHSSFRPEISVVRPWATPELLYVLLSSLPPHGIWRVFTPPPVARFFREKYRKILWGPPRGKRDCVIRHILERENGNWMKIIAWLREKSIWHPAWSAKLGVKMNFRQFLGVICAKNLRESGISWKRGLGNN